MSPLSARPGPAGLIASPGLALGWLLACLILGGASNAGILGNALLQAGAIAVIAGALWRGGEPVWPIERLLLAALAVAVCWGLLTLVPLPAALWSVLPGRAPIAEGYRLLGMELPWLPVSLSDERTLRSLLALLVPVATYLLVRRQSPQHSTRLVWMLAGLALLSVMLGIAQFVGGTESPLRPYQITNRTVAVGLFANANHFATLLLVTISLALAVSFKPGSKRRAKAQPRLPLDRIAPFGIAAVALLGLALAGSSAGLLLAAPALIIGWLIRRARSGAGTSLPVKALVLTGLVALGISASLLASGHVADKLGTSTTSRTAVTSGTLAAAADHLPTGSGLGSFAQVYLAQSGGQGTTREWMNHAHNDFAELTLEAGLPGLMALLLVLVWLVRGSWQVWQRGVADGEARDLARAAILALWLMLIHSLVDYPLRTAAIAALFGLCAALVTNALAPRPGQNAPRPGQNAPRTGQEQPPA